MVGARVRRQQVAYARRRGLSSRRPVAALMDPDELDDYLDLQDPAIRKTLTQGEQDAQHGKGRDGYALLAEFRNAHAPAGRRRRG